jgi:hypothetical protein
MQLGTGCCFVHDGCPSYDSGYHIYDARQLATSTGALCYHHDGDCSKCHQDVADVCSLGPSVDAGQVCENRYGTIHDDNNGLHRRTSLGGAKRGEHFFTYGSSKLYTRLRYHQSQFTDPLNIYIANSCL